MKRDVMFTRHLPVVGVALSVGLFLVAATYYPGGTTESSTTVGYDWTRNFISSLFEQTALNGAKNSAKNIAIVAMLVMCVSVGALFKSISNKSASKVHRKTIEIGGIGAAVYSFLVVTRMHNLMVDIGLSFALVAQLATLHLVFVLRRSLLFIVGSVFLLLLLATAGMYYGNVLWGLLPVAQKVSLVGCLGWIVAVHYVELEPGSRASR